MRSVFFCAPVMLLAVVTGSLFANYSWRTDIVEITSQVTESVLTWLSSPPVMLTTSPWLGGVFAMLLLAILGVRRRAARHQREELFESKRRRGHESVAATVFDQVAIQLEDSALAGSNRQVRCAIEYDPHFCLLITSLWAKPDFDVYVERLLSGDNDNDPEIDGETRHELMFLRNMYEEQKSTLLRPSVLTGMGEPCGIALIVRSSAWRYLASEMNPEEDCLAFSWSSTNGWIAGILARDYTFATDEGLTTRLDEYTLHIAQSERGSSLHGRELRFEAGALAVV